MGEYTSINIYKKMFKMGALSSKFEQLTWDLYKAGNNREKVERLYREVNFVNPNGRIVDLFMRFIERDGEVYQTNRGIYGSTNLPDLSYDYKFDLHDLWLSLLKPYELQMDEHETIYTEISGRELRHRFEEMELKNKENPNFFSSKIYTHYTEESQHAPSIKKRIAPIDLVSVTIGHIYFQKDMNYRDAARKGITKERKEIANKFHIPHWHENS